MPRIAARLAPGETLSSPAASTRWLRPAGLVMETFETAITWDRFPDFHASVLAATQTTAERVCGRPWSCRFARLSRWPSPYYTVLGQGKRGSSRAVG
jgi:hypothetical protein